MYKRDIWSFKNSMEVEEKHTGRYGAPGQKREKKKESHSRANQEAEPMDKSEKGTKTDQVEFFGRRLLADIYIQTGRQTKRHGGCQKGHVKSLKQIKVSLQKAGQAVKVDPKDGAGSKRSHTCACDHKPHRRRRSTACEAMEKRTSPHAAVV